MAFVVQKEVKLDDLGSGWEGASIFLNLLSFRETEEFAELSGAVDVNNPTPEGNKALFKAIGELLEKKFVRGQAFDGEKLVDLKADQLVDLPVGAINKLIENMRGNISPN